MYAPLYKEKFVSVNNRKLDFAVLVFLFLFIITKKGRLVGGAHSKILRIQLSLIITIFVDKKKK